jgi:hypothetical protein
VKKFIIFNLLLTNLAFADIQTELATKLYSLISPGQDAALEQQFVEMQKQITDKELFEKIKAVINKEEIKQEQIKFLAQIYTPAEMRAQIDFYETDIGKSSLTKTPKVVAKSQEIMQKYMMKILPILMETAMKEMAQKKQAPAK